MKKFSFISFLFVTLAVLTIGTTSAWGATYTVAGSSTAIINGSATWSPTATANDMTNVTGTWWALLVTGKTLDNSTNYQFKVCQDHAWGTAYPANNYDLYITTGGSAFNIIYTFNSSTHDVLAVPFKKWTVAGSGAVLGSNWSTTDASNAMTKESTYVYSLTKSNVELTAGTTYECKVVANNTDGEWKYAYPGSNKTFSVSTSGTYDVVFKFNIVTKEVTIQIQRTVYFVNTENWANVYCYAWGTGNNGAFPGVAMTKVAGTTLCGHDVYKCTLSANYTSCIFSAGASATKTRNLTIVPNGYFVFSAQKWYPTTAAVTADCPASGAPVMTYGVAEAIYTRKAEMQVGAVDDTTPFEDIVYYCELETPMGETYQFYQITFFANIPGYFDIINLIPCSDYTLTVWAIDNDGLMSAEPKVINFKTTCDDGDGLFLSGTMNSWATNNNDWKFQFQSNEHDRYILIKENIPAQTKYKYYQGGTWNPACNLYTENGADVAIFTAKSVATHISSLDEIYIVGPAINDGGNWNLTDARKLTWDNAISATWEGKVAKGGKYRIVVRQHYKCDDETTGVYDQWDFVQTSDQTFNLDYTNAILTFDLLTWTWKWTNADDNLCQKTGFPPAGMTADEFSGAIKGFQMGYEISIYTPSATQLVVEAKSNDWKKKAGSVAPYFLVFTEEDTKAGKVLEKRMVESGRQDVNGNKIYTLTINQGDDASNYSEDLVADFTMGACLKWAVKFEFEGGASVTNPMYYYIRQGCAPDYFEIYHHDDLPDIKGDIITQFEGGEILQPIIYRRKFTPGAWETLCLPFTCSAVRVYDPDDRMEYDLVPQHGEEDASYWLRTFGDPVEKEEFKPNWTNVPAGIELPQKNVPYIMQVPADGNYYADKYIMFYGKGYQTIANKTPWIKGSSANGFRYFGNTTMWPQNLGQAYMISYDGLWFEKSSGNTLYPFECYVVADPATTAKYVRMGFAETQEEQVATGLPSTGSDLLQYRYDGTNLYLETTANTPLTIYSVDGQLVVSSALTVNLEKAFALPPGIYIVHTQVGLTKLAL